MTNVVVEAEQLCRFFGKNQVLHNISLAISRGTVCSLLGPNGAGKTTLLKLLTGLICPTSGSCSVLGDGLWPRNDDTVKSMGCLIDGLEPPGHTRLDQLLSLSRDAGPAFDQERALALLNQKQLSPGSVWNRLSKGQKRWALLVMLLCRGCEVLLLDEPADGLDTAARRQIYQLIRQEASERGSTTFVATHIIHDIEKVADDVCILHQGRTILHEPLEDLREQLVVIEFSERVTLPDGVQVLRMETNHEISCWIRDITGELQGNILPYEIRRRHIGLEEVYLALTTEAAERIDGTSEVLSRQETSNGN